MSETAQLMQFNLAAGIGGFVGAALVALWKSRGSSKSQKPLGFDDE